MLPMYTIGCGMNGIDSKSKTYLDSYLVFEILNARHRIEKHNNRVSWAWAASECTIQSVNIRNLLAYQLWSTVSLLFLFNNLKALKDIFR